MTKPLGPELRIPDASDASVAVLPDGRFVVVWEASESNTTEIRGRIYDGDGTAVGDFSVNAAALGQIRPTVATLPNGGYVVAWQNGASGGSIGARIYGPTGAPAGNEFVVNTTATSTTVPSIAALPDGRFVVVWGSDEGAGDIRGRLYNANGTPAGNDFLVNTTTANLQSDPSVTALPDGRFLVAWSSHESTFQFGGELTRGRFYNADGTAADSDFVVTGNFSEHPSVATLPDGRAIVTWTNNDGGITSGDAFARIFSVNEMPSAGFMVNTSENHPFTLASDSHVAVLPDGRFVVLWSFAFGAVQTDPSPAGEQDIFARVFAADGTGFGSDSAINITKAGTQSEPAIAALPDGRFIAAWDSNDRGAAFHDVIVQVFSTGANRPPIIAGTPMVVTADPNTPYVFTLQDFHFSDPDAGDTLRGVRIWRIPDRGALLFDADGAGGNPATSVTANQDVSAADIAAGHLSFVPGPNPFGAPYTSFSFGVSDGADFSVSATMLVNNTDVRGTGGGDSFIAPSGLSRIAAGSGIDTITFNFKLTDATFTFSGKQVIVAGPGSHAILTGFERYVFSDGTVDNNDGNPLVDDLYYYSHNLDVWNAHANADAHYDQFGWHEGRDPSAFFSTTFYLSLNQDVKAASVNPLTHFDQAGWKEGRQPSATFDDAAYLAANPDVRAAGVNPLVHFLKNGAEEGRQPIALTSLLAPDGFDALYYLQHNPDVQAAEVDPQQHYHQLGWMEGRNPNALFDNAGYLAAYADVKNAVINPLDHFDQFGWKEGRDPSVNFDTKKYLAGYPDVAAAGIDPLVHYLQFGIHEGRLTFGDGVWG